MVFQLLSIGNKHLWSLAQLTSLKGGASWWPPLPASGGYRPWTDSSLRLNYSAVKTPPAGAWSALWRCSSLAVEECQGSIFSTLACALHRLAAQRRRPLSQQTHIPAPGKTTRTKRQLQLCKTQLKMSLEHDKGIYSTGNVRGRCHCPCLQNLNQV